MPLQPIFDMINSSYLFELFFYSFWRKTMALTKTLSATALSLSLVFSPLVMQSAFAQDGGAGAGSVAGAAAGTGTAAGATAATAAAAGGLSTAAIVSGVVVVGAAIAVAASSGGSSSGTTGSNPTR
jgi:hypothetical protein